MKVGDRMRWFHTRKAKGRDEISYMVTVKEIKPEWIVVAFDDPYLGTSNVDPADLEPAPYRVPYVFGIPPYRRTLDDMLPPEQTINRVPKVEWP